jgi:pyruvate,water dikinase
LTERRQPAGTLCFECPILKDKLEMLGRLMGAVRLLDMVLCDDARIEWHADEFMKGNYTFERAWFLRQ